MLTLSTSNFSIGDGQNINTMTRSRLVLNQQRLPLSGHWTTAPRILSDGSSTVAIALCLHIARAWQDELLCGLCRNNAPIAQFLNLLVLQSSLCSLRSQLNDQISSMYLQNHLISYKKKIGIDLKNWHWQKIECWMLERCQINIIWGIDYKYEVIGGSKSVWTERMALDVPHCTK